MLVFGTPLPYLGFKNAAVQRVVLLLVEQAERQRSQRGCREEQKQVRSRRRGCRHVQQPYWRRPSRNRSPPRLLEEAAAVKKLRWPPPAWQMQHPERVAWRPPWPEEASLLGLKVEPTLGQKQHVRKLYLFGRRGAAVYLYLRWAGPAACWLGEVWRLTRLSQPSRQWLEMPPPRSGCQLLFSLSVPVVLS